MIIPAVNYNFIVAGYGSSVVSIIMLKAFILLFIQYKCFYS